MATPFYTYKPPATVDIPKPPPNLYGINDRPGLAFENDAQRRYEALPSIYNPMRTAAKESLKEGMKGYGDMFTFSEDDPNTPVDESLNVNYNPDAVAGERYRNAALAVKWRQAARGTLYSSFADRDLGTEAERISAEAKAMVQKYAADIGDIGQREAQDANDLGGKLLQSYGEDSVWLRDQVPPKLANVGSRPDGLFTWAEWLKNRSGLKTKLPASELTPRRFFEYLKAHGVSELPSGAAAAGVTL